MVHEIPRKRGSGFRAHETLKRKRGFTFWAYEPAPRKPGSPPLYALQSHVKNQGAVDLEVSQFALGGGESIRTIAV